MRDPPPSPSPGSEVATFPEKKSDLVFWTTCSGASPGNRFGTLFSPPPQSERHLFPLFFLRAALGSSTQRSVTNKQTNRNECQQRKHVMIGA